MKISIPEQFEKMYKQYKIENKNDETIANYFFVSLSTLTKWKKELGIEKWNGKMPKDFKELYLFYKKKGLTDKEIAEALGTVRSAISRWKKVVGFESGQFRRG